MGLSQIWIIGLVLGSWVSHAQRAPEAGTSGPTDIQVLMTPKNISHQELIKKNGLIRLWPLTSSSSDIGLIDLQDSVNRSQKTSGGSKISNRAVGVTAQTCRGRTYAKFSDGAIYSNETQILGDYYRSAGYNLAEQADDYLRKKAVAAYTRSGYGVEALDPFKELHSSELVRNIQKPEFRNAVESTTSLVTVSDQNRHSRFQLQNSNYTIGGWFKPSMKKATTLLKKYFSNGGPTKVVEWELVIGGNEIWMIGYHDHEVSQEYRYLTEEQARMFRARNAHFYGSGDRYADVVERKTIQDAMANPKPGARLLPRIFVDIPVAHKSAKPVPAPSDPPKNPPVYIDPPVIPLPPGPVPIPPYPDYPSLIGWISSGKDHTLLFDIKRFWHGTANNLGGCSNCVVQGKDSDLWHFFSISVHLTDPLGPYVDVVSIRDPNQKIFGNRATISTHYRYGRFEVGDKSKSGYPGVEVSRPMLSPVAHAFKTEKGCSGPSYCTISELEIGDVTAGKGYSGYMRGVFISKKALPQPNVTEMAAEFAPLDSDLCTYSITQ